MVFSSVPLYLDPPNWQQQHEIQANPQQQAASQLGLGSSSRGSSSMAERARMAKIPVPEGPLNCPRCDSTNTKFCYFNNYSLTQPRHFCKACRRYWTRGGALRSVPVGGGCRRNKRRKRARSPKPPQPSSSAPQLTATAAEQYRQPPRLDQHLAVPTAGNPFSFMASLQNMTSMGSLGLGFGGLTPPQQQHQQQQQQQQHQQQHQLSLFGGPGFGAGLTEPSNPTSSMMMMYPFQVNGGGGVKMEEMRARAGQSRGGGAAMTDQFWATHFNNSVAGSANGGGLWN